MPVLKPNQKTVQVILPEELLSAIDDWRFSNRIDGRSEAIRWLCRAALDAGLRPGVTTAAPKPAKKR